MIPADVLLSPLAIAGFVTGVVVAFLPAAYGEIPAT